ncbi:L-lactate dehydrogenase, active site [Sesbania bispinosa]|nr:L-lactate dehydrogenase, active site [Sesbania bispinosa]
MGEHGDSTVALWSSISIGGVSVLSFLEKQQIAYEKETLENIHKTVIDNAHEGPEEDPPVSVLAKGFYSIGDAEVFLSLPAQLGRGGVLGCDYNETVPELTKLFSIK